MKILVLLAIFATLTFSSLTISRAEEGGLPGGLGTIIHEAIDPGDWYRETRHRIHEENERVDRMYDRRELSRHEVERFKHELDEMREDVQRMENEGSFSQREREHINYHLEELHRDISVERRE